jgi:colanic acid biosynthesis glycosyl transferase WcaI
VRILYVSQHFPPEMGAPAARVHELGREWARGGHRITVLTGFPNHPTGEVPEAYRAALRRGSMRESVDGIAVVRTWLYTAPNRAPRERILNYTSFFASAVVRGLALPPPDIVIGTSPQLLVGLAGWTLARRFRRPFVFEVRDLWPESLPASGIGRSGSRFYRGLEAIARFLYRSADLVVPLTEPFRDRIAAVAPAARMVVVENGVDAGRFHPLPAADAIKARLGLDGRFVVSYIGTLGFAHGLDVVLEAAAALRERRPDVLFLFVGEGAERERLEARARARGLGNVRFEGQRPRSEIPAYASASDACLVLLRDADLFRTVLPSKMLELMACGRPMIVGVGGLAAEIADQSGGGLSVAPADPRGLVVAVDRLRDDPGLGARLGRNGRRFVLDRFTREIKARTYLSALASVTAS